MSFRRGLALGLMYGIGLGMVLLSLLNLGSRLVGEGSIHPGRKHA